jgi:hypothetical protein
MNCVNCNCETDSPEVLTLKSDSASHKFLFCGDCVGSGAYNTVKSDVERLNNAD